jgi:hypothetical protein
MIRTSICLFGKTFIDSVYLHEQYVLNSGKNYFNIFIEVFTIRGSMARRMVRCVSSGNLLDADDGAGTTPSSDDENEMKNSFLPGLLGKRKYALNKKVVLYLICFQIL